MTGCDNQILLGKERSLVLVLLWTVFALSVGPSIVAGSDGLGNTSADMTEITECGEINEPGHYELTRNIENTKQSPCIEITGTDSVVFDGNGFRIREGQVGVHIRDSTDVVVKHLSVNDSKRSGIAIWKSEDIEIHGNTVTQTGTDQIWWNNSIHSWKSTDVDIHDNTVVSSLGHSDAIYVGQGSDVQIYKNDIDNASFRAITALENKNISIEGNIIENPDTDGWGVMVHDIINVTAANNTIHRAMYGIEAKDNSTDVVFRNNQIKNTTLCSIEAEGSETGAVTNVLIANNIVEDTGYLGVWVNTSNIIIKNNTLIDARDMGMYVKGGGDNVEIYGNTIINSASAAIRVADTHEPLRIYDNNIERHFLGVQVSRSSDTMIYRNRFTEVSNPLEKIESTGIEFRNNRIDKPPLYRQPDIMIGMLLVLIALLTVLLTRWVE